MREEIKNKLTEIEAERPIRMLSAREMGSRMMGVPHEDSDWDVMFVYCFEEPWKYVASGHSLKTIETSEGMIELHGWNIDKFAEHYMDSNPTVAEFLKADTYFEEEWLIWRELERDFGENFNHMALYHHYLSLAKNNHTKYISNGNDRTRGRQFYIMRAVALARYIRVEGEMPPMDTYEFLDTATDALSAEEREKLHWFADEKSAGRGDDEYHDVVGEFYEAESAAPIEPTDGRTNSPSQDAINDLVRETLQ